MQTQYPTQQRLIELSPGAAGTRETLRIMAALVRESCISHEIRGLTTQLTNHLENNDFVGEVQTCFDFVKSAIRYVQDTLGIERVENPLTLLETRAGDCDDMCTLLASMLCSIGHPCRFSAVGYSEPGLFEHVYLETRIGRRWIALDPTQPVGIGWCPLRPYVDIDCRAMMKEYI